MAIVLRLLIGAAAAVATLVLLEVLEQTPAQVNVSCVDPKELIRVKEIIVAGLDDALKDRATHLFEIWMQDPREQPHRAQIGLTNAIVAYIQAKKDALRWLPPPCDAGK